MGSLLGDIDASEVRHTGRPGRFVSISPMRAGTDPLGLGDGVVRSDCAVNCSSRGGVIL